MKQIASFDWQTNFGNVIPKLLEQYHFICVNYDGFDGSEKKRNKTREKLKNFFLMDDATADTFMECFAKFSPISIKNEYYTDLLTHLEEDIFVEHTRVHFIYANKMSEKYRKRYKKYFRDPDIREFDMQHEQWVFGGEEYALPCLYAGDRTEILPRIGTIRKVEFPSGKNCGSRMGCGDGKGLQRLYA